jgi:predicted GIY-YIG superfamily endonuclease
MQAGERSFFVYIMSNRSQTLYTGVTNTPLCRRLGTQARRRIAIFQALQAGSAGLL